MKKKILGLFLSMLLVFNSTAPTFALSPVVTGAAGTLAMAAATKGIELIYKGGKYGWIKRENAAQAKKREQFKGFRPLDEAKTLLDQVFLGDSTIKIYGQDKAKSQSGPLLLDALYNIQFTSGDTTHTVDKTGNIIYVIGPSGTGKTTLAKAIGQAILNHPDKTFLLIESGYINGRYSLADQLFRTVGSKKVGKNTRKTSGIHEEEKEAKVLDHILSWGESVVVLDDYDKMKRLSNPKANIENKQDYDEDSENGLGKMEDKSADEILKSIASNGRYYISDVEVDCSKTLFIVTTNENKAELKRNFGVDGVKGGGIQRLSVVEFEHLSLEACKRIIDDIIKDVKVELTDPKGVFKLESFNIRPETKDTIAMALFSDKEKQGRLKQDIKRGMLTPFTADLSKNFGKSFILEYTPSEDSIELGKFHKVQVTDHIKLER